jgi:DNA primase
MTAQEYLKSHGITEEFALNQGLAWDENYINIPVKDEEGEILFIKSRNLHYQEEGNKDPKYKNTSGSHATLFNLHAVKESPNIVLCEGEIDCLRLIQEGIPSISSTGGAGTFREEWVDILKAKNNVYVCYDNDAPGIEGARKILSLIPNAKAIQLPEGIKDVSEFFVSGEGKTKKDFLHLPSFTLNEWNKAHRLPDYNLVSAKDIEKMNIPPHPWLIENVIYSEGFCFIYGAEGTGKSYLALSIAKAIATGLPWLDKFPSTKGNVLFLDKENPTSLTQRRIAGLGINQDNIYWLEYPEKFQLTDYDGNASPFALELSQIVKERDINLIIIDSFVDLVTGNENSSADTQAFFNAIRELFPNIAYLPLHHENKPSQGVARSDSQRLRGSTNINAQTFTMFRLEAVAGSKTEMTLKQTKARDSLKLDKFLIRMKIKTLPDSTTTVSGFEYIGEVNDTIDDSKLSSIKETIKQEIEDSGFISRKDVLEIGLNMGASRSTILRSLDDMMDAGEVTKERKGKEMVYIADMFSDKTDNADVIDELSTPIV